MKKSVLFICIICMVLLSACGNGKSSIPVGMNEKTYEYGHRAYEVISKYNNMDIDKDDAQSRLDEISDKLHDLDSNLSDTFEGTQFSESEWNNMVEISVSYFSIDSYKSESDLKELLTP